jgi:ureidoacrylate peracid hydrolase
MGAPTDSGHRGGIYRLKGQSGTSFDPARTALLVIDPVNDFLSEGGAAWDLTKTVVTKHDVVAHLRQAIGAARDHGVPVLFAPMAFTAEDYDDQQLQRRSGVNRLMFERKMFLAGSWGADFHPDLQPEEGEVVLEPHKGMDVFETDLPEHLGRLGTAHLVIAGMAANQCCESTGRHAMEHGYDVTFLRDAIGADNIAAYEAAVRVNYPLIGNAVLDVTQFTTAIGSVSASPQPGDTVITSDHIRLGTIEEVAEPGDRRLGHILVSRGLVSSKDTYIPLDAIVKRAEGQVHINIPRIVVHKMPWDVPPTEESDREKAGPARDETAEWYGSRKPSVDENG